MNVGNSERSPGMARSSALIGAIYFPQLRVVFDSTVRHLSPGAFWAHNPKVASSNLAPATKFVTCGAGAPPYAATSTASNRAVLDLQPNLVAVRNGPHRAV